MKSKDACITIRGQQMLDGDSDVMEFMTEGLFRKGPRGRYYIAYEEGAIQGMPNCVTTVKITPEPVVTMRRQGPVDTQLIFEAGQRHLGHYETPHGGFTIGVRTSRVDVDINDNGGSIKIDYILDVNNIMQSKNGIELTVACSEKRGN